MTNRWLVIDAHNHYVPDQAAGLASVADGKDYRAIIKKRVAAGLKGFQEIERRVAFMEKAGIDRAVLNSSAWSPQGLEMCRAMNDGYAEVVRKFPERYVGCAHVPFEGGQGGLDELDRAVNELGLKGVSIVSSTARHTIDSEALFPLYEKISQLGIPIVVHPTIRPGIWGGERHGMDDHVSREYDLAKATVEVMYGVLSRFPDLIFVIPHFGGGIPALKGRIAAWYEPENWDVPLALKNLPKTPRELKDLGLDKAFEGIFGKVYFDTAGFGGWMPIAEAAAKTISADRICFGTDYPFEIHDPLGVKDFIDGIKGLDLPEVDKQNILGLNIKRIFKL